MNKVKTNPRKAVMVGCGFVGSASVFALMQSGLFSEIVLIDADKDKAEGEAMDISHGVPFARPMKIYAGDYDDAADAAIIIVSAGAGQKPGETRLDLVHKNVAIFKSIIPEIAKRGFDGILLIVANPRLRPLHNHSSPIFPSLLSMTVQNKSHTILPYQQFLHFHMAHYRKKHPSD